MVWRALLAIFCVIGYIPITNAIEISPKGTREGAVVVSLNGTIKEGDAEKLEASLESAKSLGLQVSAISLDSPGGRVSAGASMAKLVRNKQIRTIVDDGATCASACFMIFAAGKERFAGKTARIGVHSTVNPASGEDEGAKSATIDMSRFLAELGVPPTILGKLVTAKPTEMAWLTPEDLRLMRTNTAQPPSRESYVERVAPVIEKIPAKVSSENRRKADTLMTQGFSYIRVGQANQALPLLKQASSLNPYDPDIASTYGYVLHLAGQNDGAKDVLLLALQLKPDYAETHRVLGLTAAALNDQKWARESLLNYYNYSNHKDIAISEIRGMAVGKGESETIRLVSKEIISTIAKIN